jgi:hypothetical protein
LQPTFRENNMQYLIGTIGSIPKECGSKRFYLPAPVRLLFAPQKQIGGNMKINSKETKERKPNTPPIIFALFALFHLPFINGVEFAHRSGGSSDTGACACDGTYNPLPRKNQD